MKKHIKIAGAGISGLTTSINLIKKGINVEIFESKPSIAYRFKGDFQGIENWTTEEDAIDLIKSLNLDINFKYTPSNKFNVCGPNRKLKHFSSKKPLYYLIQRGFDEGYLDYGLYQQAIKNGVKINFNCKKLPKDIDIFATGPQNASAIILGCNFKTDYKDEHLMICDNDLAPKGYAYLLIVNGSGTIATAFMKDDKNAKYYFENTVKTIKNLFNFKMEDIKNFGTFGNFSTNNTFEKEGKIFIGEAAGLQDYLFGFGLRYAMYSGHLAANCISENLDYKKMAEKAFSNNIKASLVNRFLYEKLDNKKYNFLIDKVSYINDINSFLKKRYEFGLKRRIIYPLAKYKLKV